MAWQSALYFYPERIFYIGLVSLVGGFILSAPFTLIPSSPMYFTSKADAEACFEPVSFSLGLNDRGLSFPMPNLQGEIVLSFDPPRPGEEAGDIERYLVKTKQSAEFKRISIPARLDLELKGNKLGFAKGNSLFWVDFSRGTEGLVEAKGRIASLDGNLIEAGAFLAKPQESPIQSAQEFSAGSPFRLLAEARWWGKDLVKEYFGASAFAERMEIGNEFLELNKNEWLVWKDSRWQNSPAPEKNLPIARIQSSGKSLILEGWDAEGYSRLSLDFAAGTPFKLKGEELFSTIRIRSEKQISCMLEKQCMILKAGDWVLKAGGRWKILRKKEERDAFLSGKLFGEMFVLEQIQQKQGQKMILGHLFNSARTQTVPVEIAAQSMRKAGGKMTRRGQVQ